MSIPIVGQSHFVICPKGHIDELPQPMSVTFHDLHGHQVTVPLCRQCYFAFFTSSFPAKVLASSVTRKEAEWTAKAWAEQYNEELAAKEPTHVDIAPGGDNGNA